MNPVNPSHHSRPIDPAAASSEPSNSSAPPSLPEPRPSMGDPVANALLIIAEMGQKSRKLNREMKKQAAEEQRRADRRQVEKMRDAASAIRSGAIAGAISTGASAAIQGVQFVDRLGAPSAQELDSKYVLGDNPSPSDFDALHTAQNAEKSLRDREMIYALGSTLGTGGADLAKGISQAAAKEHDADAEEAASLARQAKARVDEREDVVQSDTDLINKAYEAVKSMEQSRHQAQMAIWASRG